MIKRAVNDPNNVVDEMLDGMIKAHPTKFKRHPEVDMIYRADAPIKGKVGVVTGGGSGHEPYAAGYIGDGLLDAAIPGAVFTSPAPDQVYEAIKVADGGKGVLLIILNYTGDVMNFEMAAEMAAADGITVECVVVNDDVAVEDSTWTTGRRGIAGVGMYLKVVGALAASGADLAACKAVAEKTMGSLRSMAMAMGPCTNAAVGKPSFELGDDEIEIGMGVHGEPGVKRMNWVEVDKIVDMLCDKILADMTFKSGDEAAMLINGAGAVPLMELYVVARRAADRLAELGVKIVHSWVGNYMTSLEMNGFSVSYLKLDDELKKLLLAPADSLAMSMK